MNPMTKVVYTDEVRTFFQDVVDLRIRIERCGLLLGRLTHNPHVTTVNIHQAVETPNTSPIRLHAYRISRKHADPIIVSAAERDIPLFPIGVWHTHPPGDGQLPSPMDHKGVPEGHIGAVVGVSAKKVTFYDEGAVVDLMHLYSEQVTI